MTAQVTFLELDGTFVCELPDWSQLQVQWALNAPGAGSITFLSDGLNVDTLKAAEDGLIRVRESGIDDYYFILDTEDEDEAAAEQTITFGGATTEQLLDRAVIYPPGGVGTTTHYAFTDASPGKIMYDLITQAQARGTIPNIDVSLLDASTDSAGNTWIQTLSIQYEAGTSLLKVITDLASTGYCDFRMVGTQLQMYNPDSTLGERKIGKFTATYYGTTDLSGDSILVEKLGSIDLSNREPNGQSSGWSTSIVGHYYVNLADDAVVIHLTSNDGVRLYIDGVNKIDSWEDAASAQLHSVTVALAVGWHTIEVQHYCRSGSISDTLRFQVSEDNETFHTVEVGDQVILRQAREVQNAPRKKQRSTRRSAALAVGNGGINIEYARTPSINYGRSEILYSSDQISDIGTLDALAELTVDATFNPSDGSTMTVDLDASPFLPGRDYRPGDYIFCDTKRLGSGAYAAQRVKTAAVQYAQDGGKTVSLELNDIFIDVSQYLANRIDAILNGSAAASPPADTGGLDSVAPSAPETVSITALTSLAEDGTFSIRADVSWSQVVTNEDGTACTDLQYYQMSYTLDGGDTWTGDVVTKGTSVFVNSLPVGATMTARVRAVDLSGNFSDYTESTALVFPTTYELPVTLSTPIVTSLFGGVRAQWDGVDEDGDALGANFKGTINVYASTTADFTPAADNLQATLAPVPNVTCTIVGFDYNEDVYVAFTLVDALGEEGLPSEQAYATVRQGEDADFENISATKINAGILHVDETTSISIQTADSGQRLVINSNGLFAYNSLDTNTVSIESDGTATFTGTITSSTINSSTLNAATVNSTLIQASTIYGTNISTAAAGPAVSLGPNYYSQASNDSTQVKFYAGTAYDTAYPTLNYEEYDSNSDGSVDVKLFRFQGAVKSTSLALQARLLLYSTDSPTNAGIAALHGNSVVIEADNSSGGTVNIYGDFGSGKEVYVNKIGIESTAPTGSNNTVISLAPGNVGFYFRMNDKSTDAPVHGASFTQSSSMEVKTSVKTAKLKALDKIHNVRTVSFKRKGISGRELGFIAEELRDHFPDAVIDDERGLPGINILSLSAVLWDAVTNLKTEHEKLLSDLAELKETR